MIVLCEDALHRSFGTRFFREARIPAGKDPEFMMMGGKTAVLEEFPRQVRAIRSRRSEAHLIVMIDGDDWPDARIVEELDRRLRDNDMPDISTDDRVLVVVPRWEMETWVRHLRGEKVGEQKSGAHKLAEDSEARPMAAKLANQCMKGIPLDNPLESLVEACNKWQAYRRKHNL